ncbi:MAG: NACHT domain-containing protein, partial [bacterium]|nr:NACHT domain-containing protein [bacterium]
MPQQPPDTPRNINTGRDYHENVDGNVYTGTVNIHPPDSSDPDALQRYYLQSLLRQMDRVDLSGIDRKASGQQQESSLRLSAIYTALLTLSAEQDNFMPDESHSTRLTEKRLSALAQVNQHQHLVLLGGPGSGKSTFVKFVALCLAGDLLQNEQINLKFLTTPLPEKERDKEQPPSPQPWKHGALLPILVILRDFAARGLPPEGQSATGKNLWDFIADGLKNALLQDYIPFLLKHLRERGGLILLDGLDEVPEAYRRRVQIKQAVEQFRDFFPRCRIVVTSRTYAYQQQEWRLQGFADTVLAPFSDAQIKFFVEHWYGHMATVRGMDLDNAQGQAELLKRTILHSERLQDFAKRPLLLTLMASLHAWRGGSLPEKRGELYAEATDLLLNWWEQAKVVKTPDGRTVIEQPCLAEVLQVGQERIFQALTELAFQSHAGQSELNRIADISEESLLAALFSLSKNKDLRPGRLIEFLSDRAGLLVSHGNRMYSFPHRSFQEYLAACYLTEGEIEEEGYPENSALLIHRDPERWREVVLLAAAKASGGSSRMIWLMLDVFCERSPDDPDVNAGDAWCALLAGQALVETLNLQQISSRNQ